MKIIYSMTELQDCIEIANTTGITGTSSINLKEAVENIVEAYLDPDKDVLKGVVYSYYDYKDDDILCSFSTRVKNRENAHLREIDITEVFQEHIATQMEDGFNSILEAGNDLVSTLEVLEAAKDSSKNTKH